MISISLLRRTSIALVAAVITLSLFAFMAKLIDAEHPQQIETVQVPEFEIAPIIKDKEPIKKQIELKLKEELVEPTIPQRTVSGTDTGITAQTIETIKMPTLSTEYNRGSMTSEALPIVQVSPRYPISAAQNGKEGYVILGFDITKMGTVTNVKVLEANPKRIFNKAAIQAIKNWKYKPKMEKGVAVIQSNQQVQLDFTLEQQI
ncbi:energy transducer TonB [Shewanella woodyi]|uniref:energy transducer TonB n=1 Tax=Shewanella woodyi TaxID=60961 RepID=UPI003748FE00